jgi:hypothetical protein
MIDKLEVDGVWYHASEVWEDGKPTGVLGLVRDEDDHPIPATQCICYAYEPAECVCGAWDDVDMDWWYDEDEPC